MQNCSSYLPPPSLFYHCPAGPDLGLGKLEGCPGLPPHMSYHLLFFGILGYAGPPQPYYWRLPRCLLMSKSGSAVQFILNKRMTITWLVFTCLVVCTEGAVQWERKQPRAPPGDQRPSPDAFKPQSGQDKHQLQETSKLTRIETFNTLLSTRTLNLRSVFKCVCACACARALKEGRKCFI